MVRLVDEVEVRGERVGLEPHHLRRTLPLDLFAKFTHEPRLAATRLAHKLHLSRTSPVQLHLTKRRPRARQAPRSRPTKFRWA